MTQQQSQHSIVLPPEREFESSIYRSPHAKDGLLELYWPEVTTLYSGLERSVKLYGESPALGWREKTATGDQGFGGGGPYLWLTYNEVAHLTRSIGSALSQLCDAKPGSYIGIFSINSKEWSLVEHGCHHQSLVPVPLYDTLGAEASEFIINQTLMEVLFISKNNFKTLKDSLIHCPSLKWIIIMNNFSNNKNPQQKQRPEKTEGSRQDKEKEGLGLGNITVIKLTEFIKRGEKDIVPPIPPKPDDLATICYTSGTTGDPKGVMLTHRAIVADLSSCKKHGVDIVESDVHISYLPLAHMLERIILNGILSSGARAGFFRGDVLKIVEDIQELKPTIFVSVPRLYNRIYDKVVSSVETKGFVSQTLFKWAVDSKTQSFHENRDVKHMLWDSVVFASVRTTFGGNVRLLITGSAPLAPQIMDFFRCALSCPFIEGYGQTETVAAATLTTHENPSPGSVGTVLPSAEMKVVDVPEMDYRSTDKEGPRGEVCFRGPICATGYFKAPEKTAELIDSHGWLHTGDIGLILPDGSLKIIDRKKNIFKLSQGEYVAPEKIENVLNRSKYIAQSFIYGESLQHCLVAIIVIDKETLVPWALQNNIQDVNEDMLCVNETVRKLIAKEIQDISVASHLHGFEIPKEFHLTSVGFSIENSLLTPTFKLKRQQLKQKYQNLIAQMYRSIESKRSAPGSS